jgi:hypothetical protein
VSVPAPVQKRPLLGGYPRHDALLPVLRFFKKTLDNYDVTDRMSKRSFDGKLDLVRSKDDDLHGARCCYSFKVPSTYAFAAMERLAHTHNSSPQSFIRPLFKSIQVTTKTSVSNNFHDKTAQGYLSNSPSSRGSRTSGHS